MHNEERAGGGEAARVRRRVSRKSPTMPTGHGTANSGVSRRCLGEERTRECARSLRANCRLVCRALSRCMPDLISRNRDRYFRDSERIQLPLPRQRQAPLLITHVVDPRPLPLLAPSFLLSFLSSPSFVSFPLASPCTELSAAADVITRESRIILFVHATPAQRIISDIGCQREYAARVIITANCNNVAKESDSPISVISANARGRKRTRTKLTA